MVLPSRSHTLWREIKHSSQQYKMLVSSRKWQLQFYRGSEEGKMASSRPWQSMLEVSGTASKVIALIENMKDSYNLEWHKMMIPWRVPWVGTVSSSFLFSGLIEGSCRQNCQNSRLGPDDRGFECQTIVYVLEDGRLLNVLNREMKEIVLWEDEWHG